MLLCLDIGNSHICGGVFNNNQLTLQFRHVTCNDITADQLGIFLKNILRENNYDPHQITMLALCSVVPALDYALQTACKKYFQLEPFILSPSVKTPIKIKTTNPAENGADIIAGVIAATHYYPHQNLIIIDCGTVTTIAAVTNNQEYLGVTFIPGMHLAMHSLSLHTAKLVSVEIATPATALGRSTLESTQAGLYFGHLGAIKEITTRITHEIFATSPPLVVATGGFAPLFLPERYFNYLIPELVLQGIKIAYEFNKNDK